MRREPFTFTGSTREYFGIWIVNVLLTLVTLGVYSAWAKVRRQRYFHGSTRLAGASFDYHAKPIRILIGRVIVLAMLVGYNLAPHFLPVVGGFAGRGLPVRGALFVMRGLRFRAPRDQLSKRALRFQGRLWRGVPGLCAGRLADVGHARPAGADRLTMDVAVP